MVQDRGIVISIQVAEVTKFNYCWSVMWCLQQSI